MNSTVSKITFLPRVNEIWGKVMFSQVFVCPQWGLCPSMHHRWHDQVGVSVQGSLCPKGSLSRWGLCLGGLYQGGSLSGRTPWKRPPYSNKRAARILLECISVYYIKVNKFSFRWNWISTLKSLYLPNGTQHWSIHQRFSCSKTSVTTWYFSHIKPFISWIFCCPQTHNLIIHPSNH